MYCSMTATISQPLQQLFKPRFVSVDLIDALKAARGRQYPRISQEGAARILRVHRVTYANYERGVQPVPDEHLFTLAREWKAPELLAYVMSPMLQYVQIPYWGTVPMGGWEQPSGDVSVIEVPARYAGDGRVAVTAAGYSMADTILPADLVIFRLTPAARVDSVVLARSDDQELAIKRYVYRGGLPILICDDPDYPPVEVKKASIIAQFVALIREDL
jgi:SOS-response transcriptional repressor LexA